MPIRGAFQPLNPGNMSRHIYQKESILVSVDPWSAGVAVTAGVSPIYNIHQAHHLPAMSLHPDRVRATHFCVKLRHYKILHGVPTPIFSNGCPTGSDHGRSVVGGNFMTQNETNNKAAHSVSADFLFPSASRYISKFGVVPNVGFSRRIDSRSALYSPATFPSGVLIFTRIKLVISSRKPTAGRASRLIRYNSVAVSPRQVVPACESAGPLSSHQTRISL